MSDRYEEFDDALEQYWASQHCLRRFDDNQTHLAWCREWLEHDDESVLEIYKAWLSYSSTGGDPVLAVQVALSYLLLIYSRIARLFDYVNGRLFVTYEEMAIAARPYFKNHQHEYSDYVWKSYIIEYLDFLDLHGVKRVRRPADKALVFDVQKHLGPGFKKFGLVLK